MGKFKFDGSQMSSIISFPCDAETRGRRERANEKRKREEQLKQHPASWNIDTFANVALCGMSCFSAFAYATATHIACWPTFKFSAICLCIASTGFDHAKANMSHREQYTFRLLPLCHTHIHTHTLHRLKWCMWRAHIECAVIKHNSILNLFDNLLYSFWPLAGCVEMLTDTENRFEYLVRFMRLPFWLLQNATLYSEDTSLSIVHVVHVDCNVWNQ